MVGFYDQFMHNYSYMDMVRTTIEFPRDLYVEAKMMAILVGKPLSQLMRAALAEKIKELKEQNKNASSSKD